MKIEITNPMAPRIKIPTAETFATCSNSFLDGFLKTYQTLLHFTRNDFVGWIIFTIE